ncbi:MAG: FHA domain-containing protein [Bdellovibrionota bacterium]
MKKASLHIISGTPERRVTPLDVGTYILGRGSQANVQIPSREISRKHAQIIVSEDEIILQDCGSANGTLLNGNKIMLEKLKSGDQITVANVTLELRIDDDSDQPTGNKQSFANQATLYLAATKVTQKLRPKQLWPFFVALFGVAFVALSIFGRLSFKSLLKQRLHRDAISRAQGLVKYLAEKNREDVKLNNQLLLDVDSITKERGVVKAYIINNKGRILAPIRNIDENNSDPFVMEALAHDSDQSMLPSPPLPDGTQILVHPIRSYNDTTGKYENIGVAKIVFSADKSIGELKEANQLMIVLIMLSVLLSVLLGWMASKTLINPIQQLAEKIQQWRTGQSYTQDTPPFEDFKPLYEAVERAIEEVDQ